MVGIKMTQFANKKRLQKNADCRQSWGLDFLDYLKGQCNEMAVD